MSLDLVYVACLQARLHFGDGLRCGGLIVNDLLCDAFEIDEQLQNIFRDDRQTLRDGEQAVEDVVGDARVFHRERVKRADGVGEFERDLLDRVDHVLVILDHLADVVQRVGELI